MSFSCRLPVLVQGRPKNGWTGGFITFPAASYKTDPTGVITTLPDGGLVTNGPPSLSGYLQSGWPFYDLAQKSWLPASYGQTSPDGSSYAFSEPANQGPPLAIVHIAEAGFQVRDIAEPPSGVGQGWLVADYDGHYEWLVATQVDQPPRGVWLLDAARSAPEQLLPTSAGNVLEVQDGLAWLGLVNPGDPSPPNPGKGVGFDTIARVDLTTGAETTWIYRPGEAVFFWGLDSSDNPVVQVVPLPATGTAPPLVLVDSPGANGIAIPAGFLPQGAMEADHGRIWFGGPDGIYYWTQATGLLKVYSFESDPSLQLTILPAGHCV